MTHERSAATEYGPTVWTNVDKQKLAIPALRGLHIDDLPSSEDLGWEADRFLFRQDHRQNIGGLFG